MRKTLKKLISKTLHSLNINPGATAMRLLGVVTYNSGTNTYMRDIMGHIMHLHTSDPGLSQALMRFGMREAESVMAINQYMRSDMTVLELGANIGFYALLEARILSKGTGRIIAIEPLPENLRLLKLNLEQNGYSDKATILHAACSNRTGTAEFVISELSNCGKLADASGEEQNFRKIIVPTYTFRDLLTEAKIASGKVDFIRMDIEGAEYVLLPEILKATKYQPELLMFIEFHPGKDTDAHQKIMKLLQNEGFECLNAVKEYIDGGVTKRKYCPKASIADLYTDTFFTQGGGIETFLRKRSAQAS